MSGPQEEDKIPAHAMLIGLGLSIVAMVVLAYALSTEFVKHHRAPLFVQSELPGGEPPRFGMLEQRPFETETSGEELRAAQQRRLESYGWVDRDAGVAHIPIDRAMQIVASEPSKW